jgi:hypothetical protein
MLMASQQPPINTQKKGIPTKKHNFAKDEKFVLRNREGFLVSITNMQCNHNKASDACAWCVVNTL